MRRVRNCTRNSMNGARIVRVESEREESERENKKKGEMKWSPMVFISFSSNPVALSLSLTHTYPHTHTLIFPHSKIKCWKVFHINCIVHIFHAKTIKCIKYALKTLSALNGLRVSACASSFPHIFTAFVHDLLLNCYYSRAHLICVICLFRSIDI